MKTAIIFLFLMTQSMAAFGANSCFTAEGTVEAVSGNAVTHPIAVGDKVFTTFTTFRDVANQNLYWDCDTTNIPHTFENAFNGSYSMTGSLAAESGLTAVVANQLGDSSSVDHTRVPGQSQTLYYSTGANGRAINIDLSGPETGFFQRRNDFCQTMKLPPRPSDFANKKLRVSSVIGFTVSHADVISDLKFGGAVKRDKTPFSYHQNHPTNSPWSGMTFGNSGATPNNQTIGAYGSQLVAWTNTVNYYLSFMSPSSPPIRFTPDQFNAALMNLQGDSFNPYTNRISVGAVARLLKSLTGTTFSAEYFRPNEVPVQSNKIKFVDRFVQGKACLNTMPVLNVSSSGAVSTGGHFLNAREPRESSFVSNLQINIFDPNSTSPLPTQVGYTNRLEAVALYPTRFIGSVINTIDRPFPQGTPLPVNPNDTGRSFFTIRVFTNGQSYSNLSDFTSSFGMAGKVSFSSPISNTIPSVQYIEGGLLQPVGGGATQLSSTTDYIFGAPQYFNSTRDLDLNVFATSSTPVKIQVIGVNFSGVEQVVNYVHPTNLPTSNVVAKRIRFNPNASAQGIVTIQ